MQGGEGGLLTFPGERTRAATPLIRPAPDKTIRAFGSPNDFARVTPERPQRAQALTVCYPASANNRFRCQLAEAVLDRHFEARGERPCQKLPPIVCPHEHGHELHRRKFTHRLHHAIDLKAAN